jgi:hypothetical protein
MTNSSHRASFTPAEQSRLSAFKAVGAKSLYSDTNCEGPLTYHFGPDELERLAIYSCAIQAGFFTDQFDSQSETTSGN